MNPSILVENLSKRFENVVAVSILFGTTSMLAVTVTFEKKQRSFERLLLSTVSHDFSLWAVFPH
ncbi:MAG: hypothetical protein U5L07_08990 [Desulfobacterales bacterium]|nr:hypothetical protein [Desulfobacterales bacterium]